jgi:5-methylcytosine-specific restriction endonuclease McrA
MDLAQQVKKCCVCEKNKEISLFHKNKSAKDGLAAQCKECAKAYADAHKEDRKSFPSSTPEYRTEYLQENKEHINELRRESYAVNPEPFKIVSKKSRTKHKAKRNKESADYYANNTDYCKSQERVYYQNNKEAHLLRNRKRQKMLTGKNITQQEVNIMLASHNNKCFYCQCDVIRGINLHLDHKIPLAKGGEHKIENIVPACPSCNLRKGRKTAEEFFEFLKLYSEENICQ